LSQGDNIPLACFVYDFVLFFLFYYNTVVVGSTSGTFKLLGELLHHLEAYEASAPSAHSLPDFLAWVQRRTVGQGAGPAMSEPEIRQASHAEGNIMLTILITYLYRYAKHYGKKALADSSLSTLDEFSFLATLRFRGDLTKSELIHLHLLELTSGIEILKRLEKKGFVEVFPDPADRRSRRVRISYAGAAALDAIMPQMNQVARIVSGNLGPEGLTRLMPLLHQLNAFHSVIHQEDRQSELETITEKYLS